VYNALNLGFLVILKTVCDRRVFVKKKKKWSVHYINKKKPYFKAAGIWLGKKYFG
jgi:hypothetical protein